MDGGDDSRGSPKGSVKKAANYKFPKVYSTAYTAFSKRSFSTQDIVRVAALVGIDRLSHKDTAQELTDWPQRRIEAFHSNTRL